MSLTLNEKFQVSSIIQDISQIIFGSIASYSQCFCLSASYRYRNLYRPITIPIPIYRPIPIPKLYRSHTGTSRTFIGYIILDDHLHSFKPLGRQIIEMICYQHHMDVRYLCRLQGNYNKTWRLEVMIKGFCLQFFVKTFYKYLFIHNILTRK